MQIAIIFAAGCEIHQRFACREEKKFRDMAEAYFRILDEDLSSKDGMCGDTTIKNELQYEWGSKDKLTMTAGDTLRRKGKEIRNKLCSTIISSSNIT